MMTPKLSSQRSILNSFKEAGEMNLGLFILYQGKEGLDYLDIDNTAMVHPVLVG